MEWNPKSTAPTDGTIILGAEMYRFVKYKPSGQKQIGKVGRWQKYNGYGWENAEAPEYWTTGPNNQENE